MGYGVFRVEKLKGGAVYAKNRENNRTAADAGKFRSSDIDWTKTHENVFLRRCDSWSQEADRLIHERVHQKKAVRKDAVKILDAVFTCSPEDMMELERSGRVLDFFRDCMKWYEDHYGMVINAVIHLDETTPHMHVQSIPITKDGRLSASELVGNKKKMSNAQQAVEDAVFRKYGLLHRNVREAGQAKKHQIKAEYLARQAEEKAAALRNEMAESEKKKKSRLSDAERYKGTNTELRHIHDRADHSTPTLGFGRESYTLSANDYRRLRTLASVGNDAMNELDELRRERDEADARASAAEKQATEARQKMQTAEEANRQRLIDLRAEGALYFQAPSYVKRELEKTRQDHLAFCRDVDRAIVAAYVTAPESDGVSGTYQQRLNVAAAYAKPYMPTVYNGNITSNTARRYAERCIEECRRQCRGHAPSPSSDGWHHKIKQTDFSLPPETGAVPLRVPIGDDRDDDDMGTKNWNLMSEFEKEELMMRELMRSI